jgi:hypothetical protein
MYYAIMQGIIDLKELDWVKRKEAKAAYQAATAQLAEGSSRGGLASSLVDRDLLKL